MTTVFLAVGIVFCFFALIVIVHELILWRRRRRAWKKYEARRGPVDLTGRRRKP